MATAAVSGCNTAEAEALKHAFSYLVNSLDTSSLLLPALSTGLIRAPQKADCDAVDNLYKKAETFLGHLQREVNGDSQKFHAFVSLLDNSEHFSLASRLRGELNNAEKSLVKFSGSAKGNQKIIIVPFEVVSQLASLRINYASLLYKYKMELEKNAEAQETFVGLLSGLLHKDLSSDFQTCYSMLINEEVSLFNIKYLEYFCNQFPQDVCKTTTKLVANYEKQCQHFMSSTTMNQFRELFPASALTYETSTGKIPFLLKLHHKWGDMTLSDLTDLVLSEFGPSGNQLHLAKVNEGCIAVLWLTSNTNGKELVPIIDASNTLRSKGVLQVFVEDVLVLDYSQHNRGYFDIILIGRTGLGKSSLGNKLLHSMPILPEQDQKHIFRTADDVEQKLSTTSRCKLVCNEVSKIRVLDTPGLSNSDLIPDGQGASFKVCRMILHSLLDPRIKMAAVQRLLYFFPHVDKFDGSLQEELAAIYHYFGSAMFNNMVIIATRPKRYQSIEFTLKDEEEVRDIFLRALHRVMNDRNVTNCPPILYIGIDDHHTKVLSAVMNAKILGRSSGFVTNYRDFICSRCAGTVRCILGKTVVPIVIIYNQDVLPYEESNCHPQFVPKYSKVEKLLGGLGLVSGFTYSDDEVCSFCKRHRGSRGCCHVKQQLTIPGQNVSVLVDHSFEL